jgi:hypothetical protein
MPGWPELMPECREVGEDGARADPDEPEPLPEQSSARTVS